MPRWNGPDWPAPGAFKARAKPFWVLTLFDLQGQAILDQPLFIVLIAVPIVIQSDGIFTLACTAAGILKVPHKVAAPGALIGTSNFLELAVAVAIRLFGLGSGAALATVVGVLVEVSVMLGLVVFANRSLAGFTGSLSSRLQVT